MARVVVTGSNRGIGLELVRQQLARGDQVYATCRNPETATELINCSLSILIHWWSYQWM